MGTSSSSSGASGGNPLIPTWILIDNGLSDEGTPEIETGPENTETAQDDTSNHDSTTGAKPKPETNNPLPKDNNVVDPALKRRFTQPRKDFNTYVRSGGKESTALKKALTGYSRKASGNTSKLARRMTPAVSRLSLFSQAVNTIKSKGVENALQQFNLESYTNSSVADILSALSDVIFRDTGKIYENTQDDNINKLAYANTIIKISEVDGIDLNSLTNDNIEVMMAIFIEETIVQRVLNDIGNEITKITSDIKLLLDIENNVYQIVNGLVRNKIMPEIKATQRGNKLKIEKEVENIYRIAFDAMANINE